MGLANTVHFVGALENTTDPWYHAEPILAEPKLDMGKLCVLYNDLCDMPMNNISAKP